MPHSKLRITFLAASFACGCWLSAHAGRAEMVRLATFNLQDVRTEQLADDQNARLKLLAAVIQQANPDVILLNELAYDAGSDPPGQNGQRFADLFLAVPQAEGLEGILYESFMAPCNTGIHSGLDLNRDSVVDARPGSSSYANDCWGYGEFPGHYAMALLVRKSLAIDLSRIRTFQLLRWAAMRGALAPRGAESTESWYPADPDEGDSRNNPVGRLLLQHPRLAAGPAPVCCISSLSTPGRLSADDTATWGLRVDYVLPSRDLVVIGSEVVRHSTEADEPPSDHFLVWIEVKCP